MTAVLYLRVSDEHQIEGTSLDMQEEACRAFAAQQDLEVSAVFREEGQSAKDLSRKNRGELVKALEYCQKHQKAVSSFVVWKLDRFARNTEDHFALRKVLYGYGVTLLSVTEPIGKNPSDPSEKFIETVLAGAAEYDNAVRRQRSVSGMSSRVDSGIYPWMAPLGYLCDRNNKRGKKKTEADKPDPAVFPILKQGLQEFSKGLHTQGSLAKRFDELGLAGVRGKPMTSQDIYRMLRPKRLDFYAGLLHNPWTGETVQGQHEQLITQAERDAIQNILDDKKPGPKKVRFHKKFPLKKTLRCHRCSSFFTASSVKGRHKKYPYYHCYNKQCRGRKTFHSAAEVEEQFQKHLNSRIVVRKEAADQLLKKHVAKWQKRQQARREAVNARKQQRGVLEERKGRIFEMRESGDYSREEFNERKDAIDRSIALIDEQLDDSNNLGAVSIHRGCEQLAVFASQLSHVVPLLGPEERYRFQKILYPEGATYSRSKGIGTAKLGLCFALLERPNTRKSPLVRQQSEGLNDEEWLEVISQAEELTKLLPPDDAE